MLALQLIQPVYDRIQVAEVNECLPVLIRIKRRRSHKYGTRLCYALRDTRLCGNDRIVCYLQMPYNTYLPAKHAVLTDLGRTCYHIACCQVAVLSYLYIVRYVYEVIKFHSFADDGRTERSTVYSTVSTYLHIVFYHHIAYLRYLFITLILRCKTKSIATDDRT